MSDAKLIANRENAQKSTGPQTEEGKKAAAYNSMRHGLRSNQICVLEHEQEDFGILRGELVDEIKPAGELEALAFERLIHAAWSLRRIRISEATLEQQCFDRGVDPFLDDESAPRFKRLADYQRRAESTYARALKEIRELQTDRHFREELPASLDYAQAPGLSDARQVRRAVAAFERSCRSSGDPVRANPSRGSYSGNRSTRETM